MIVVEALKIGNMSRSASGTLDHPGKNVKAKSGLNKSILDQAWGEFKRQISYKLAWKGGIYLEVPAPDTSQTCSVCGEKDKASRQSQARYVCDRTLYYHASPFNLFKSQAFGANIKLAEVLSHDSIINHMGLKKLSSSLHLANQS